MKSPKDDILSAPAGQPKPHIQTESMLREKVLTPRSGVSACQWRHVLDILYTKDLCGSLVEWETDGGTGRRNVLEGSSGGEVKRGR
jgi:hypothetical protein